MQRITITLLSAFSLQLSAFAQGPLTPPGPPAPTFKTLQQVEPRTPITNATGLTIGTPGSYYLTTNITVASGDGIVIAVANVTLDLNGFTILSTNSTALGLGIRVTQNDVTILNGHIVGGVTNSGPGVYSGPGFLTGIGWFAVGPPRNVRVSGVTISGCQFGINLLKASSTAVQSCTMQTIGFYGIYAGVVSDSVVFDCGDTAIYADTASNCRGTITGPGAGINANNANNCYGTSSGSGTGLVAVTAINCSGSSASGKGVFATTAIGCSGISSNGNGNGVEAISASDCYGYCNGGGNGVLATTVNNCYGFNTGGGAGVSATTANNCYGQSSSGIGLLAVVANNCRGWSVSGNGLYVFQMATGCSGHSGSAASAALYCQGTAQACSGENVAGGTAIQAAVGIGCQTFGGTNSIPASSKFLGTL